MKAESKVSYNFRDCNQCDVQGAFDRSTARARWVELNKYHEEYMLELKREYLAKCEV